MHLSVYNASNSAGHSKPSFPATRVTAASAAPKVEEQLSQALSLIELTQDTLRQARRPSAAEAIEDLIKQGETERKALNGIMKQASESKDFVLFEQVQRVRILGMKWAESSCRDFSLLYSLGRGRSEGRDRRIASVAENAYSSGIPEEANKKGVIEFR